jgi:hypothetical protein
MKPLPSKKEVEKARGESPWGFGNDLLYRLCKENFGHSSTDRILAKVLFIGRIYAAAVERGRGKSDVINDDFYIRTVVPAFRKSRIDRDLLALKSIKSVKTEDIPSVLQVHDRLTRELEKITGLQKRSFASKYLHFHLPEHFHIYDSRADIALRQFVDRVPVDLSGILADNRFDPTYAKFFCKCFGLKRSIDHRYGIVLSNRELDNLLIQRANQMAVEKNRPKGASKKGSHPERVRSGFSRRS